LTAWRTKAVYALLVFLLLVHPILYAAQGLASPRTREEIKPVLVRLQENRRPEDRVYVYAGAKAALDYYALRSGLVLSEFQIGTWAGDSEGARRDLETLRGGGRTWILFSHSVRPDGTDDEEEFLPLLDGAGRRLEEFRAPGAAVYLYDMDKRPPGGARP